MGTSDDAKEGIMFDLLKKSILAGLGTAVVTKGKVQEAIQKMVEQGRLSTEEAERLTNEVIDTGEKEYNDLREEVNKSLNKALAGMNLASRQEMETLQMKVENLEKRLEHLEEKIYEPGSSASSE
jgi:polyhydroxyalkanoate synthesis regulator phasin